MLVGGWFVFYNKFQPGLTKRSEFMYSPVKYYFGLTNNGYGVGWVVFVKIKDWAKKINIRFKVKSEIHISEGSKTELTLILMQRGRPKKLTKQILHISKYFIMYIFWLFLTFPILV